MADYARAELLRELRAATHLSREKVAGEIDVTTKTLYAWENGGSIKWENAKKLAAFYGVEAEALVSRELDADQNGHVAVNGTQLDRIEATLADLSERLRRLEGVLTIALPLFAQALDVPSEQIAPPAGTARRRAS